MTQVLDRIRNGVDSAQMYGTLDAIKENPALGIFQFRAQNHWIDGATTAPPSRFSASGGHHPRAPSTPAARSTSSTPANWPLLPDDRRLVYIATARKIRLTEVNSTLEGDMDVRGASASATRSATASRTSA